MKKQFLSDLESQLEKLSQERNGPRSQHVPEDYINSEDPTMTYLNLRIPQLREKLKETMQVFKEKNVSFDDQFEAMEHLWFNAKSFEARAVALFWLENQDTEFLAAKAKGLVKWIDRIGNWAHSDSYASTLARIFEFDQKKLLTTFKSWNKHKNSWRRRNSMVGLMLYARLRKKHPSFDLCKAMINTQIDAPEYYVQKAVGWTLREMYNVYPKQTFAYVQKNIKRISPAAWYATGEKMTVKEKTALLKLRKAKTK